MRRAPAVLLSSVCCLIACRGQQTDDVTAQVQGEIWITDVTIVSAERQAPHTYVVVRDGRIASVDTAVPGAAKPGTTVIDGSGKYLVPGLIDGHVHLVGVPGMTPAHEAAMPAAVSAYDRQLPRSYLYFGFTAVVDLNVLDRPRLERLRSADVGPAIFDCGNALAFANSYPMSFLPPAERFARYPNFLYDPRQAGSIPKEYSPEDHSPEAAVGRVAAAGGRCVKGHYEPGFGNVAGRLPVPTPELLIAVREAAHRRGLPFLLHANSLDAHRVAVAVRPDAVVHGMWNQGSGRPETAADVRAVFDGERLRGIGMMPTSRAVTGLADLLAPAFLDDRQLAHVVPAEILAWYRTQEGQWFARDVAGGMPEERRAVLLNVGAQGARAAMGFARAGGRLVFGSDTPSAPTYANPPGYNGYLELRELEAAGISPRQLLTAATVENARLFGLVGEYGTIEPGKVASLLLLRGDPLVSTTAFDTIEMVMVKGRPLRRETLSAALH